MSDRNDNAEVMAQNAMCDGIRMLWRGVSRDVMMQRYEQLFDLVVNNTDCEHDEFTRYVKSHWLRNEDNPQGSLVSWKITGKAARVIDFLPWAWAERIMEVHMKTWAEEVFQGATTGFVDRLYATDDQGVMKANFFGRDKRKSTPKAGGSKGARLGSKKSDVQVVVYKRANERPGLEVKVQDKVLFRIWLDVDEMNSATYGTMPATALWSVYTLKASRAGFRRFSAELKRRGVRLTDYFSSVHHTPTGAVLVDGATALNSMEDAALPG